MTDQQISPSADLERIIASAQRLGIELDEEEALQWLTAIAVKQDDDEITMDVRSGVFGHKVVMLDFSDEQLAYFRRIGKLVEFEDVPGVVETALALSGSSAQSKIQTYPGDADYFERVNIIASSREEACRILAEIMREKALSTMQGDTYQLIEVKFGNYPYDLMRGERMHKAGTPISWTAEEIKLGKIEGELADGSEAVVTWEQASVDPGWCKLDWVIADPIRNELANASNMLDVTWEALDGTITPLDGYLDPYFQEVYLQAESVPIFSKLAQHVSANALDDYVAQLENEVRKYVTHTPPNYGKAAKRMYNVFRLTGRYQEAAFLRELFDEPAAMLYQVWSLIRTIDDCCNPSSPINQQAMLKQADDLIISVVQALEGEQESEVVRQLLRLRDALTRQETDQELTTEAEAARDQVIQIVNNLFYERLTAIPEINQYLSSMQE
jgi:hypothetical protein